MDPREMIAAREMRRSGGSGRILVHFGMLLATLAFASWWTSHTILDTARTRRVTDAVLENADLRHYVAGRIASVTTPAVGANTLSAATGTTHAANPGASGQQALQNRLDAVLDRPDVRAQLERFVTDAHAQLIGVATKPATLDETTVRTLVASAVPTLGIQDLAKLHSVRFQVPHVAVLSAGRNTLSHRFWLYFLGAAVLIALAIATSRDRRATLRTIGMWLLGISVVHLLVLWIVPVMVVPHVTHSPWADLIAAVARALSAGIVTGLVLLAAAGAAFLLVDLFVPRAQPALAPETVPES
jgi:hypothetical protein